MKSSLPATEWSS